MERWVGSVRHECLDRVLIVGRRHSNTSSASTPGTTTSSGPTCTPTCQATHEIEGEASLETRARGFSVDLSPTVYGTDALVDAYGLRPEQIHVYSHEVPDDRCGRGVLASERAAEVTPGCG